MGIFDKWFAPKGETQQELKTNPIDTASVTQEINSILLVLGSLGMMKKDVIKERISEKETYNENILNRLEIKEPNGLDYLDKYFGKAKFGYGSSKIRMLREKYETFAREKLEARIPREEVVNQLISFAQNDINAYETILKKFNESIRLAEEESHSYMDIVSVVDYWKEYYKEQELGYPVPLEERVARMKQELKDLPFGGYGSMELQKFEDSCKKMIEEARLSGEDSHHTMSRITSDIFTPYKNRFLGDVDRLNKKKQMIDESPYLSDFDKAKNKQKLMEEFKKMNGHQKLEESFSLEQLMKNLTQLEMGGYGEEIINKFAKRAETMISDGKRIMKPEEEVRREIEADYQRLLDAYESKLKIANDKIKELDKLYLSQAEKEIKKKAIIEEFQDEVGLPIDYEERINQMAQELQELERGGYGELKVSEFKTNAFERLERASTREEVRDALKEIREIQTHMINTYNEELKKLSDKVGRTTHDRHLSDDEKDKAIEEFSRDFKFNMGYRMNFEKYIENRADDLRSLAGGGYGEEAIEEFCNEAKTILEISDNDRDKYDKIRGKYGMLRKQYLRNVKIFEEWKKTELAKKEESERDNLEKDMNVKIPYMLSLSPRALYEYYVEDDRKKKEAMEKHNEMVAFKYLARKEATYQKEDAIYQRRLEEWSEGKNPYTRDEIEEAVKELEFRSLTTNDLKEDERIISMMEYIDSTLLRQMMYAEASLMQINR